MTIATLDQQLRDITEKVVREAREELLRDADRQEWVNRIYQVPEDAVEAARWTRIRLRAMETGR